MRFKKLVETILTEDIESMKKYYPNISDDAFQSYVELDPTYKDGSTQAGKYAKWILGLANKGKLDNIGHVKDVLSRFDEEKNNLKEKDIMKYKSVDEVEAMLNDENSYKALSDRQRLRQTQKAVHNTDLDQDAERLFNGKDWEVWTPHTYEASCKLGRGTQWCTASTESDHYFRSYTKSGKLYIIINKHNGEKYQFHFESASFMDAQDESIPIAKFLLDNRELNDYFYAILPDEVKEQVENLKDLADNDYVFVYHGDIPQKMKYVFRYIEKIIVERDITKIPDKEFHKLIGLKEVSLHDNITYIGESAFEDCENLEYINLPHNLEHLGDYAFDGCVRLKSIKINSELQMLPMFAFSYTDAKRIDVPGNINVIGNGAFCNTELQTVILNEGVQVISSHAFSGSDKLTSIKLPHSLNKIDSRAFRNCTSLQKIVIPKEVEYVGHRVFGNCPNLTVYCEAEEQPIRWETDWNHRAEVVWGYKGEGVKESYKMRFKYNRNSEILTEGTKYDKKAVTLLVNSGLFDEEVASKVVEALFKEDIHAFNHAPNWLEKYLIGIVNMLITYCNGDPSKAQGFLEESIDVFDEYLTWVKEVRPQVDTHKQLQMDKEFNEQMSYQDLVDKLDKINSERDEQSKERLKKMTFGSSSNYELIPIDSFDTFNKLFGGKATGDGSSDKYAGGGGTAWCHANDSRTYASWVRKGTAKFFVLANKGWKSIPFSKESNEMNAKDDYGTSLIAILVNTITGDLLRATLRCNHVGVSDRADNQYTTYADLSDVAGFNVEEKVKEELNELTDVARIEDEAFLDCTSLTNITIPDSVTSIGRAAFRGCTGLTSITVPDGVTSIGGTAFSNCTNLTSIIIPDSVTSIGEAAFEGCTSLTSITIPDGINSIGDSMFSNCTSLTSVTIPDSVTIIGDEAFADCENLRKVVIGNGVTSIGFFAFFGCTNLTSVTIPDSVTSIGEHAFRACKSLTSIAIPNSVTSIDYGAFWGCKSLTSVSIGNSVTSIDERAFAACTSLTSITIPDSVRSIDSRAFYNCERLTSVTITYRGTKISNKAFEGCNLTSIRCVRGSYAERYANELGIPTNYLNESYKMRFKLTEGKNLEQTVQQYIDKYKKIVPAADDELHRNQVMGLIAIDPTYKEGSTTTGDYAIWILNMAIKNGWDVIGARDKLLPLLTDFMDKKSQLPNKDINSYKSVEDLEIALKNCTLTDRQKERKARNASSKTKKVLETDNWEVYAALNWEGALTLGKGTSWCTATSDNASWYAKYISDIWWDDDWDAFEVRDHAKNHLSEDEIIDMVKNSHISDIEPTTIDDIYANYSDRAVFLTVNNDTTFLVNPYEQVPVEICNTLYVFIRKGYPSERYQFCMSYDLQEIEDDYYNAITFCDASDRAISFDDFVEREPELKAFWTETLGQRLTDLLGDDEEDIEESYSMRFKLSGGMENSKMRFILTEDIAAVRKNYPKISDEDFDRLIKLDPTYREGSNSVGTYGKWILNLFNKGKLDNEGHVFDILTRFEESKKNLKNKDIGKFKTLEELDDYLNDEDNYKSLSNRQVTRQNQNARRNADLGNEAEKVFDGSKWEVWIPKTYAASCKLGQGSSWCTASTSSDYYYNYYTRQGNLFININKHDSEDKYQFHFETGSFMDINDRPITLTDFLSDSANAELHDFYYPIIAKSIGVEIGGADYDLVLDFNGGAFARVLGYWGENYANRDSVGTDFIRQLLTGDGYDLFYYDGMMTIRDSNDLPTISQSVREELKRLGLVIDDLWAIVDEEIEDDEGNEIPYADEILDAVDQATMDAVIVGTEDEAMSDIEKAMTREDGEGYVFTVDQGNLILSASPETLVDAYLEMSEGELPDILRDDSAIAADILVERWASTFRCYEPQYGWNGFSDDAFNEALADRLSEITA